MKANFFSPLASLLAALLCCLATMTVSAAEPQASSKSAGEVDFAKEIQPLLARRCFACHGPDDAEGGLRLDMREHAIAELDSGSFAIVPEQPDQSVLLERIASDEEGVRMPPEGKPLTADEQDRLRRWIKAGAQWKKHWAFEPVSRPPVPAVAGAPRRNPIDAFIDQKLADQGLKPSPAATPAQLLRRVYFDLIGLPPTPQQTDDFLRRAERDFEQAYEQEVDQLLASPQFGERWARHWLDVVRYAETNSFERDGPKPNAWRYRDYVIRAFNDDKPYDQFLKEQLAGDELPQVTKESLIATGFYRLGVWDDEPADRELAVYDVFDDILTTVGQGLMGLTINCCRCHDHKIDPIPAKDYYGMLAFFRNLTPNGYGPNVERPLLATEEDRQRFMAVESAVRAESDRLQKQVTLYEQELRQQLSRLTATKVTAADLDGLEYRFYRDTFKQLPDFDKLKAEDTGKTPTPYLDISLATRPDHFGFVFTGTLIVPTDGEYEFILDSDDGSRVTIDGRVIVEYDGIHGEGNPRTQKVTLNQGRRAIRVDYFQGLHGKGLTLLWSGPGFERRSLTPPQQTAPVNLAQALKTSAAAQLGKETLAAYRRAKKQLADHEAKKSWDEYGLCVSENGTQAPQTFVLLRGSPEAKGEAVEPRFPSVLDDAPVHATPNDQCKTTGRRLALANWITSADNHLTGRVIVNRLWQHHFGRGIVRSPNNFGQLGEPPTHPELLDWLATDLVENGWRLKRVHKLMLLSDAYRRSSLPTEDAAKRDPNNDWFSHFNLRRLSAEEIRDGILATNGRLNAAMFGPSIYPEISKEVLAGQSVPGKGWAQSSEQDQVRRSIYIHVKRSLVVPMLASFDFPETDASCESRFITTQPGQALGMLNGDFMNQEAAHLSQRLLTEAGENPVDQIRLAYRLVLAREPSAGETARAAKLMTDLQSQHSLSIDQATSYFCLFMYNLNEFIYLD